MGPNSNWPKLFQEDFHYNSTIGEYPGCCWGNKCVDKPEYSLGWQTENRQGIQFLTNSVLCPKHYQKLPKKKTLKITADEKEKMTLQEYLAENEKFQGFDFNQNMLDIEKDPILFPKYFQECERLKMTNAVVSDAAKKAIEFFKNRKNSAEWYYGIKWTEAKSKKEKNKIIEELKNDEKLYTAHILENFLESLNGDT